MIDGLWDCEEKPVNERVILDLCGGTGSWSRPYAQAGYRVILVTLPDHDVRTYEPPIDVHGVLAAPPCTEFSLAGYRPDRTPDFEGGMEIVNACLSIIRKCRPKWWALENPVGHLSKFLGEPTFKFQPWWFGDAWVKMTYIWGKFTPPRRLYMRWEDVEKIPGLYVRPGRTKPSLAFQHKSAARLIKQLSWHTPTTDAELRAMTPPGFAEAFMRANP